MLRRFRIGGEGYSVIFYFSFSFFLKPPTANSPLLRLFFQNNADSKGWGIAGFVLEVIPAPKLLELGGVGVVLGTVSGEKIETLERIGEDLSEKPNCGAFKPFVSFAVPSNVVIV